MIDDIGIRRVQTVHADLVKSGLSVTPDHSPVPAWLSASKALVRIQRLR